MLVNVGDILLDRDSRRAGREVEVVSMDNYSVTIKTIKSIAGVPVTDGTVSVVGKSRLAKAYRRKFTKLVTDGTDGTDVIRGNVGNKNVSHMSFEPMKEEIIESIMELAKPGNQVILDRISAIESRLNGMEYGGHNYYYGTPTVTSGTVDASDIDTTLGVMTGSMVSNYPSIEEVLEKVLPETESDEFEYLWERLASEDKNPHEAVVRLVYNLLTK